MHSDQDDHAEQRALASSFRLAAVAVVSAILTATVVIGGGQALISHRAEAHDPLTPVENQALTRTPALLVRTTG